jgi:flagellar protein FlgJ
MALSGMDVGGLALDSQGLDKLKLQAKQAPDQALQIAAKQFETVFLNMMLKSMRDATPQDGMFDSEQTKMFTGMLDQQLAQSMANRGVGLADLMVRQLSRSQAVTPSVAAGTTAATTNSIPSAYKADTQQDFVDRLKAPAEQASRSTGIPAHMILGQAALESGWGKREIKMADGSDSHNLFGIKAGKEWNGKVAEVTTTEYHNGVASKQVERFRAYASATDAFQDYAKLLKDDPRYAKVLDQADSKVFAQAMQQAGYATDPRYADKLAAVIGSVRARA